MCRVFLRPVRHALARLRTIKSPGEKQGPVSAVNRPACLSGWRWLACGWAETLLSPAYLASPLLAHLRSLARPSRQIGGVHRWGQGSRESVLALSHSLAFSLSLSLSRFHFSKHTQLGLSSSSTPTWKKCHETDGDMMWLKLN